jgi:hypothetical protein
MALSDNGQYLIDQLLHVIHSRLHVLIYCIIDKIEILFVIGTNFAISGPDYVEVKVCQHSFSFGLTVLEVDIMVSSL